MSGRESGMGLARYFSEDVDSHSHLQRLVKWSCYRDGSTYLLN